MTKRTLPKWESLPVDLANWDPDYERLEDAYLYGGLRAVVSAYLQELRRVGFVILAADTFETLCELYESEDV